MKRLIKQMNDEFNRYINALKKKEVPWWNNERSVLGFFISGLIRNSNNVVLQEYSCKKGFRAKDKGRADLLFKYGREMYIAEAKLCWTSINTSGDFGKAQNWAKRVLAQGKKYAADEREIKKGNVCSLCFEVLYCKRCEANYKEKIEDGWNDAKKALDYLHYYALILLKNNKVEFKDRTFCYPAIAIYGLFDRK